MVKIFEGQQEKYKIGIVAVLLTGACLSLYYFHVVLMTGTVIAHAFYIPVMLAAFWWKKKGLIVALFSSAFLIFSNNFFRPEVVTANDYWRALFLVVTAVIVAMLSRFLAIATERFKHLNLVLRAIRNVNQLIAREKDRDRLLQSVCDEIIATRGYHNAWIALLDESSGLVGSAEAGLGKDFLPMLELLKRRELPDCARKALAQPGVLTIENPSLICADCPMAGNYHGRAGKAVRLEHGGKVYGLLVASVPREFTEVGEEESLFKEVASDIAFALRNIELEKELKRAEEELKQRAAKLETANRELEAFSYSASHDLRAPLRTIDGFSNILLEEYSDKLDDEGKRILDIIQRNTRQMAQLIDDLLEFSRLGRQEMRSAEIDMGKLAGSVFKEIKRNSPGRKLQLNIDKLPPVRGDRMMIRQVLNNLLSNAIKFTGPKKIGIIEVGGRKEDNQNIYYVKDNGVGFDMQYANKLFGVFQRLHSSEEFEGTGVGLAIVQRIIHRHGGRVWGEGKVDKGATFYFTLPTTKENRHAI